MFVPGYPGDVEREIDRQVTEGLGKGREGKGTSSEERAVELGPQSIRKESLGHSGRKGQMPPGGPGGKAAFTRGSGGLEEAGGRGSGAGPPRRLGDEPGCAGHRQWAVRTRVCRGCAVCGDRRLPRSVCCSCCPLQRSLVIRRHLYLLTRLFSSSPRRLRAGWGRGSGLWDMM